jgi:hypothetical protein
MTENAREAAEQGDLDGLMRTVADGYADAGGRDRNALRGLLAFYLRQHGRIHVLFREKALELQGPDDAHVRAAVALAGQPIGSGIDLRQIQADLLRVDLTLRREDGEWKVIAASWEPAGAADFLGD